MPMHNMQSFSIFCIERDCSLLFRYTCKQRIWWWDSTYAIPISVASFLIKSYFNVPLVFHRKSKWKKSEWKIFACALCMFNRRNLTKCQFKYAHSLQRLPSTYKFFNVSLRKSIWWSIVCVEHISSFISFCSFYNFRFFFSICFLF